MARYATNTTVSVDRSQAELRDLVKRFGADKFLTGESENPPMQFVAFELAGRSYRLDIPMPDVSDFVKGPRGRPRSKTAQEAAYWAEVRRLWRVLVHVCKAILVGVEEGLWTFEEAMIPTFGLLPDQRTVREALVAQVDGYLATGRIPIMLPPGREL